MSDFIEMITRLQLPIVVSFVFFIIAYETQNVVIFILGLILALIVNHLTTLKE